MSAVAMVSQLSAAAPAAGMLRGFTAPLSGLLAWKEQHEGADDVVPVANVTEPETPAVPALAD